MRYMLFVLFSFCFSCGALLNQNRGNTHSSNNAPMDANSNPTDIQDNPSCPPQVQCPPPTKARTREQLVEIVNGSRPRERILRATVPNDEPDIFMFNFQFKPGQSNVVGTITSVIPKQYGWRYEECPQGFRLSYNGGAQDISYERTTEETSTLLIEHIKFYIPLWLNSYYRDIQYVNGNLCGDEFSLSNNTLTQIKQFIEDACDAGE